MDSLSAYGWEVDVENNFFVDGDFSGSLEAFIICSVLSRLSFVVSLVINFSMVVRFCSADVAASVVATVVVVVVVVDVVVNVVVDVVLGGVVTVIKWNTCI